MERTISHKFWLLYFHASLAKLVRIRFLLTGFWKLHTKPGEYDGLPSRIGSGFGNNFMNQGHLDYDPLAFMS